MTHRRIVAVLTTALLSMIVTGCAGLATDPGVGLTDPAGSSAARLSGTWRGHFAHPGADYTSPPGNTDLTLQVGDDSTYTFTWSGRPQMRGTVTARGNRVFLHDASGSRITLMLSGDTLYGMMKDPEARGRRTVVSLEQVETGVTRSARPAADRPTTRSRLCEAAGGVYAHGICQPTTTPDWRAYCEARGGTYFRAGFCEVPAGGLRPL